MYFSSRCSFIFPQTDWISFLFFFFFTAFFLQSYRFRFFFLPWLLITLSIYLLRYQDKRIPQKQQTREIRRREEGKKQGRNRENYISNINKSLLILLFYYPYGLKLHSCVCRGWHITFFCYFFFIIIHFI